MTLRGLPLYRYSKDRDRRDAKGQGIESFGGIWHAMTAASGERRTSLADGPEPTPGTPKAADDADDAQHAPPRRRLLSAALQSRRFAAAS